MNKKLLFVILGIILLILGIVAYFVFIGSGSSAENNTELETDSVYKSENTYDEQSDSLAATIGSLLGGSYVNYLDTLSDKSKYNKDEIIKSVEYVINIDTANMSKQIGVSMGLQLLGQITQLEQLGAKIERKKVLEEFSKALNESLSMEKINEYTSTISSYTSSSSVDNETLSTAIGASAGGGIAYQIDQLPDSIPMKSKISKKEIVKGLEYSINTNSANMGRQFGISIGLQLAGQITQLEQMGAKIDRKKVIKEFSKAIKQNSVSTDELNELNKYLQMSYNRLMDNSPEAIKGTKAGETFINDLKKKDAEIKTTASGLSYKILDEGVGAKASDKNMVKVKYKGSLIDGTVFEDYKGEAREFPVSGVVPGFAEGLKLLGKGGKAILYIPGKLGYGAQGQPQAGIGPNAMLIFEIEVTEIK